MFQIIIDIALSKIPYVSQKSVPVKNAKYITREISFIDLVFIDLYSWGNGARDVKAPAISPTISNCPTICHLLVSLKERFVFHEQVFLKETQITSR